LLHMEDDWQFLYRHDYVTNSIYILCDDPNIGQVLFNKNYAEIDFSKKNISGGIVCKTKDKSMRYLLHEHYDVDTNEYSEFLERHKNKLTCGYWPHFSFRPSLLKVTMLREVGEFYNTIFFEMAYACDYVNAQYKSAFFDRFCATHIGKKTWEKDTNAYSLNNMNQFGIGTTNNKCVFVITDNLITVNQWKNMKNLLNKHINFYVKHRTRKIKALSELEKILFRNNNFNYCRKQIEPMMVHFDIWNNYNEFSYLLVINNAQFVDDNAKNELFNIVNNLNNTLIDNCTTLCVLDRLSSDSKINLLSVSGYIISSNSKNAMIEKFKINGISDCELIIDINDFTNVMFSEIFCANNSNIDINITDDHNINTNYENNYIFEGYNFYSQCDSYGDDICYYSDKQLLELKELCDKDPTAIGFNTLGWIKNKICDAKDFIFLPKSCKPTQGLYVKKQLDN